MRKLSLLIVLFFAICPSTSALEIVDVTWGFDGRILQNRFAPVSILLKNDSSSDFRGAVSLVRNESGAGEQRLRELVISAGAKRWVQFVPLVTLAESYSLKWGSGITERILLPSPSLGPPARVFLAPPAGIEAAVRGVPSFPAEIFPNASTALDGLDGVLVDHDLDFSKSQEQSFLDWLHSGGTLHLLLRSDGAYPRFQGVLEELNRSVRVGCGRVIRHPKRRFEIDGFALSRQGHGPLRAATRGTKWNSGPLGLTLLNHLDLRRFKILRAFRPIPKHPWGSILIAGIAYLALIGPAAWILGRRARRTSDTIGYTLLIVAMFSAIFSYLGRRGIDATTLVHGISYARQIQGADFDLSCWSDVTSPVGETLQLHLGGESQLYSCTHDLLGATLRGQKGSLEMAIPVNSSRPMWSRSRLPGPFELKTPKLSLQSRRLHDFEATAIGFGAGRCAAIVYFRRRFSSAVIEGGRLCLEAGLGEEFLDFEDSPGMTNEDVHQMIELARWCDPGNELSTLFRSWSKGATPRQRRALISQDHFGRRRLYLMLRALDFSQGYDRRLRHPKRRVVDVFVAAPSPKSWRLRGARGEEETCCLLHFSIDMDTEEAK